MFRHLGALDLENLQDVFAHVADHYGAAIPVRVGTKTTSRGIKRIGTRNVWGLAI